MKTIELERKKINESEWLRRPVLDSDCTTVIEGPCRITSNGQTLAIVDEVTESTAGFFAAVNSIQRFDVGSRASGITTTSKVFGFMPRTPTRNHRDYCSAASLAHEQPQVHEMICRFSTIMDWYYEKHLPEQRLKQLETVRSHVLPEWMIQGTPFTSGIVNKNNPLAYHKDRGNFAGCWSAMIVMKKHVTGGDLILPEFGVRLSLPDRSILLFDGQSVWHGVTPIRKLSPQALRYSVVFYSLKQMAQCMSCSEELKRAQKVRQEREMRRAGMLPDEEST